jgi:MoaA/NifB/PqqE/SkfB family radical SAM enzyme
MQPDYLQPHTVCLDASTACQLRCPSCPTTTRTIKTHLDSGTLKFTDFREFLQANPYVRHVELSNWGELFINPDLLSILQYAHEQGVSLSAENGVNFNHASDEIIRALVQYRFRSMTVSIDGIEQDTYVTYRRRGNVDRVIRNIRLLNQYKRQYASKLPRLRWQFIAFGHNQQDIAQARALAAELNMEFFLKLSWEDLYTETFSPVTDQELVRQESGLHVADREEYAARYDSHYAGSTCYQLWLQPRINFDGRLLGCAINYWSDFGNVYDKGLSSCLAGDKMVRTKRVLLGQQPVTDDIPCSHCQVFNERQATGNWVNEKDLIIEHQRLSGPDSGIAASLRQLTSRLRQLLRHWLS